MDGFDLPGLTESIIIFNYVVPAVLLVLSLWQIDRILDPKKVFKPMSASIVLALILLYMPDLISDFHDGGGTLDLLFILLAITSVAVGIFSARLKS